nr:hypothetical protein [Tanacetum cinerariifolium]
MSLLQEALDACAAITRRVEHLEYDKVAQEITKLKRRVKKLEKGNKAKVLKLRRLQRVRTSQRVDTSDDIVMDDESNQQRMIDEMDKDVDVVLMDENEEDKMVEEAKIDESTQTKSNDKGKRIMVEEPKPPKKKQQIELDEEYARKLHDELNKDIDWDEEINHVERKAKEDPAVKRYQVLKRKPHIEGQARKNMIMYLKSVAGFK